MFNKSTLNSEEIARIQKWVSEGDQLNDLQRKIQTELSKSITYLDTRFLMLDLGLEIRSPKEDVPEEEEEASLEQIEQELENPEVKHPDQSGVAVSVDSIKRPGAVASGSVTWSDGVNCSWHLDEMGRLGLDSPVEDYRPEQADITEFQEKLRELLGA